MNQTLESKPSGKAIFKLRNKETPSELDSSERTIECASDINSMEDQSVADNNNQLNPNDESQQDKRSFDIGKVALLLVWLTATIAGIIAIVRLNKNSGRPAKSPVQSLVPSPVATQIQIPIKRVFDVQWSPPGHPMLMVNWLQRPYFDRFEEDRDGYYTFEMKTGGVIGFVRKRMDDSVVEIFDEVEFKLISKDVLMFLGHRHGAWVPAGGGFGTIIKAPSIPDDSAADKYSTQMIENSETTAEEWLIKNFGPPVQEFLPIQISTERAFDAQWNPPGHPTLVVSWLQIPYFDTEEDRNGYYTFEKKSGGVLGFVRKRMDGSVVEIFDEVEFKLISEDILMFLGHRNSAWVPAGGGYGTIIKAPSIPEGNTDGKWPTQMIENSETTAEEWLIKNFGIAAP